MSKFLNGLMIITAVGIGSIAATGGANAAETFPELKRAARDFINSSPSCSKSNVERARKLKRDVVYAEPTRDLNENETLEFLEQKKKVVAWLVPYLKGCPDYKTPNKPKPIENIDYARAVELTDAFLQKHGGPNKWNAKKGAHLYESIYLAWQKLREDAADRNETDRLFQELLQRLEPFKLAFERIENSRYFIVTRAAGAKIYTFNESTGAYNEVVTVPRGSKLKIDMRKKFQSPFGMVRGGVSFASYHKKLGLTKERRREINRLPIFVADRDISLKTDVRPDFYFAGEPRYISTRVISRSGANVRELRKVYDKKSKAEVWALVAVDKLSRGERVQVNVNGIWAAARYYSRGRVKTTSVPYVQLRGYGGKRYLFMRDLQTSKIIASRFNENLPKGAGPAPVRYRWSDCNPKGTWAHYVSEALKRPDNRYLLDSPPSDMAKFCRGYAGASEGQKIAFWTTLLTHISKKESNFNPFTASDEGFFDPNLEGVISSGLSQISLGSAQNSCYQARGCDAIADQQDMYDPKKNLSCAIAIWSCQIEKENCIACKKGRRWYGIASYWSPMKGQYLVDCSVRKCRRGYAQLGNRETIMLKVKKDLSFCR